MTTTGTRRVSLSEAVRAADARARADIDRDTLQMSTGDAISVTADARLVGLLHKALAGKYELEGHLGQGGMGTVFLARDVSLGREVAIKVMLPEMVAGTDLAARFRREARTVAVLNHPNIIPVYAVHESEEIAFFVMRYVEGRTLESILRHYGPLPFEIVRSIVRQVGRGLVCAHRHGVIHRDIKPANVMIDADGWALIADFGIAKVRGSHDLTLTGTTVGTPKYMSPEQCSDAPLTAASDQYALGIVAFEMLTGQPPFSGSTVAAVVKQHLFDTPPRVDKAVPGCPPELATAVARMLAKTPEGRWPSIAHALREIGGTVPPDGEEARVQIAHVASHGLATPVTLFEAVVPADRTTARMDGAVRGGRLGRAARPVFGGVLGVAAVLAGVLTLGSGAFDAPEAGANDQPAVPATIAPPESVQTSIAPAGGDDVAGDDTAAVRTSRSTDPPTPRQATSSVAASVTETGVGRIYLGTRPGHSPVLYVDGAARGAITGLAHWPVSAGAVTLSMREDGCEPWDTTVTVRSDSTVRIGYRSPKCDE